MTTKTYIQKIQEQVDKNTQDIKEIESILLEMSTQIGAIIHRNASKDWKA